MWAAIGAAAVVVTGVIVVAAGSTGSNGWRELAPRPEGQDWSEGKLVSRAWLWSPRP